MQFSVQSVVAAFAVIAWLCTIGSSPAASEPLGERLTAGAKAYDATGADPAKLATFCELDAFMDTILDEDGMGTASDAQTAKIDAYLDKIGPDVKRAWKLSEEMDSKDKSAEHNAYLDAYEKLTKRCSGGKVVASGDKVADASGTTYRDAATGFTISFPRPFKEEAETFNDKDNALRRQINLSTDGEDEVFAAAIYEYSPGFLAKTGAQNVLDRFAKKDGIVTIEKVELKGFPARRELSKFASGNHHLRHFAVKGDALLVFGYIGKASDIASDTVTKFVASANF